MAQEQKCGFGYHRKRMRCRPFRTRYTDTRIFGVVTSIDTFPTPVGWGRDFRIGLGLGVCTVGLRFLSVWSYRYKCSGCGVIGWGTRTRLPQGWQFYFPAEVCHFFCPTCNASHAIVGRVLSNHA
jgi:hypothetical protein